MDLTAFAAEVGAEGPVTCVGARRQWDVGGPVAPGTREVGAGRDRLDRARGDDRGLRRGHAPWPSSTPRWPSDGQLVALPAWGTVGGVLAVGRSDVRRLGYGPVRDTLLQAGVVTAEGLVVKVGRPDGQERERLRPCRLLVGSLGTLGFIGDVILRTRPRPPRAGWYRAAAGADPFALFRALYRPASVLWDGTTTWVLLEGHAGDVRQQAAEHGLDEVGGPPSLPPHRHSVPPADLRDLTGAFVAEIGVGVVHRDRAGAGPRPSSAVVELHRALRARFDPTGRLNPGRDPLAR